MEHSEAHLVGRAGWLRAAVLGANDGIVSTASLIAGVASASARPSEILITGLAGLVAGAMSMAAGEYVSVSSQLDTEHADLAREAAELKRDVNFEREELAQIYVKRGVDYLLAVKVAEQLMAKDALGSHARDELGITEISPARPIQAAVTSAASFAAGAVLPLSAAFFASKDTVVASVAICSLAVLAILGAAGAKAGGANILKATTRVTFWGALAIALTAVIGKLFGAVV